MLLEVSDVLLDVEETVQALLTLCGCCPGMLVPADGG